MKKLLKLQIIADEKGIMKKEDIAGFSPIEIIGLYELMIKENLEKLKPNFKIQKGGNQNG